MSYINFLGCGSGGAQLNYRRDFYNQDTVKSVETSHLYEGKAVVQPSKSPIVKEVIIDQAVKVTTVADSIRNAAQEVWSDLKNGTMGTFTATLILGIGASVGSVLLGVLLPTLWPIAVAVGIVALALLGFSVWNLCRSLEAKGMLNEWNDPLPSYQQTRMMVPDKGFYHAYSSGHLGKYVSQAEFEKLWFASMDQWADKYQGHVDSFGVKVLDIRQFMEECPLQLGALQSTFGPASDTDSNEITFIRDLGEKYSGLKGQYNSVRQQTEALKSKIKAERKSKLLENDHWLHKNLAPYEAMLNAQKLALLSQRTHYTQVITVWETQYRPVAHTTYQPIAYYPHHQPQHTTLTMGGHVVPGASAHMSLTFPHKHRPMVTHAPVTTYSAMPVTTPHEIVVARSNLLEINAKIAKLEAIYNAMTYPLRSVHASNAAKVKSWADGELTKIQASEDTTLVKFYPPIKAILDAYKNRNVEVEVEEVEAEIELPIDEEAPDLKEDYDVAPYDPSWKEFVGEVDWENGIVKKTMIEHKGNKTQITSKTTHS